MTAQQLTYSTRNPCHQPVWLSWAVLLAFAGLAVLPVIPMLARSLMVNDTLSLQTYFSLFSDNRTTALLIRSAAMSLGATLLALVFGLPLAMFLIKTNFPGKKLARITYLLPLFIPPHIHALAWIYMIGEKSYIQLSIMNLLNRSEPLFNIYSPAGVSFILFLAYFPILVLTVSAGLSQLDRRLEETAGFYVPPLIVWKKITLPLIGPYIVSGSVFVFIFSFFNYGIPSMLRVSSYPVEIFVRFSAFYDESGALALSAPLVAIALALLLFQKKYMANQPYVSISGSSRSLSIGTTPKSSIAAFYIWCFILLSVVMPIAALISQAESLKSFEIAWNTSYIELTTSVVVSGLAATVCTIIAYFFAVYLEELNGFRKDLLSCVSLLPFAFPATLFGIALIHLWNRPLVQIIYSTYLIIIIAYIARFIPFAVQIIAANLKQISPAIKEAAVVSRDSRWARLLRIELPLVKKGLVICWAFIFIFSMGELGATLLVIPPGGGTVSLKIYTLMHYGAGPLVAALALILLATNLLISSTLLLAISKK